MKMKSTFLNIQLKLRLLLGLLLKLLYLLRPDFRQLLQRADAEMAQKRLGGPEENRAARRLSLEISLYK